MARRNRYLLAFLIVVAALVGLRLALPYAVKDYVNRKLQSLEAYDGSVGDIDLHLWRGAYRVVDIRIVKTGANQPVPFFSSDHVDFSVEWRSLFRGSLVAEGIFFSPDLNLVQAESKEKSQLGTEVNWAQKIEDLSPFRFNTVRVRDGRVTFTAPGIATKDALTIEHLEGELLNLTNVAGSNEETFARFRATGRGLGNAPIALNGRFDPWARQPTFDVDLKLENVQLPQVNPWLREYIKADAERGQFELYLEAAAADGSFKGYAKPLMSDVDMYRSEEPEESALKRVWESVVDFAAGVLKNKETGDVAARIPFSGTIRNPETGVFEAMVSILRNAFVTAFSRSLEGSISLRDVKKNLRSLDTKDEKAAK